MTTEPPDSGKQEVTLTISVNDARMILSILAELEMCAFSDQAVPSFIHRLILRHSGPISIPDNPGLSHGEVGVALNELGARMRHSLGWGPEPGSVNGTVHTVRCSVDAWEQELPGIQIAGVQFSQVRDRDDGQVDLEFFAEGLPGDAEFRDLVSRLDAWAGTIGGHYRGHSLSLV